MMRQSPLISSLSLSLCLSFFYTARHLPVSASLGCLYRPSWTDVSVSGPAALDRCSGAIIHLSMGKRSMERWGLLAISYSEKDSEVVSRSAGSSLLRHNGREAGSSVGIKMKGMEPGFTVWSFIMIPQLDAWMDERGLGSDDFSAMSCGKKWEFCGTVLLWSSYEMT